MKYRQRRHQSHRLWWGIAIVILALVCAAAFALWYLQTKKETKSFTSQKAGMSASYDASLEAQMLTSKDTKDNVILRLAGVSPETPELLITLRYESGLKPITTLTKQDLRDALTDTIEKAYPKRFPGYKPDDKRNFELDGHKAGETTFTYKGPSGQIIKQRFIVVVRNNDMAIYLAAQAKKNDFDTVNNNYFEPLVQSLDIN